MKYTRFEIKLAVAIATFLSYRALSNFLWKNLCTPIFYPELNFATHRIVEFQTLSLPRGGQNSRKILIAKCPASLSFLFFSTQPLVFRPHKHTK